MKVSLKEFVQDGTLGSVRLGLSNATIENLLGAPENWEAKDINHLHANIWKYGDIEFYFKHGTLWMIFMDVFKALTGGSKIILDTWVISKELTCSQAEEILSLLGVPYLKENFPLNDNGVHIVTKAGTILSFCGKDTARPTLHSISRRLEDFRA